MQPACRALTTTCPALCRAKLSSGQQADWPALNVGASVTLYGRLYHITGCDGATRAWLEGQGVHQAPNSAPPESPIDLARREKAAKDQERERPESVAPRLKTAFTTPSGNNATQQFLEHDGKVLRFYAGKQKRIKWVSCHNGPDHSQRAPI